MYFITQQKSNTLLIGIYNNYVYAYGKEYSMLVIYRKCVFDASDWETFFRTNTIIPLHTGFYFYNHYNIALPKMINKMPLASGIFGSNIWVVGSMKAIWYNSFNMYVFSLDCITKDINFYPINCTNFGRHLIDTLTFETNEYFISSHKYENGCHCFTVVPHKLNNSDQYYWFELKVNEKQNFAFVTTCQVTTIRPIDDKVLVGKSSEILYVGKKNKNNLVNHLLVYWNNATVRMHFADINYSSDATTYQKNNEYFMIFKRKQLNGSYKISVEKIRNSDVNVLDFLPIEKFFVDENLPDFGSSHIFMAPNILLFSSSNGIATVINRPLTLSESAYVTLLRSPFAALKCFRNEKETFLQKWIKWFWGYNETEKPILSLKYIQKALKSPNLIKLKHF